LSLTGSPEVHVVAHGLALAGDVEGVGVVGRAVHRIPPVVLGVHGGGAVGLDGEGGAAAEVVVVEGDHLGGVVAAQADAVGGESVVLDGEVAGQHVRAVAHPHADGAVVEGVVRDRHGRHVAVGARAVLGEADAVGAVGQGVAVNERR